jgi:hypothetical protein
MAGHQLISVWAYAAAVVAASASVETVILRNMVAFPEWSVVTPG